MEKARNTQKLIITIMIPVLLLTGAAVALFTINQSSDEQQAQSQAEDAQDPGTLTFTAEAGKTVLEQTKARADVETQDAGFGAYVYAINGLEAGTDDKYWTYFVDGQPADRGAADYVTEGGETVEWKFGKFE
jgi:hypothetical protein